MFPFLKELFAAQQYNADQFFLIAGPCVVEDEQLLMTVADRVGGICKNLGIPYVFKASYRKANRTSAKSFTGIGDEEALRLLGKVKEKYGLPVTSDIHAHDEAEMAAQYLDVLQIPAFLCRQTDLLVAAAHTNKIVNVKKGQFLSGESMKFAADKIKEAGNDKVMLTERGNSFGYTDLVVDYRNIPVMQTNKVPVIMDCTHSLQQPNQSSGVTGGNPEMIGTIASAAIAAGVDGLFIETHPQPEIAKSDGANMLHLDKIEELLQRLTKLREVVVKNRQKFPVTFVNRPA